MGQRCRPKFRRDVERLAGRLSRDSFPSQAAEPVSRSSGAHPRIVDALTSLIGPNVKCMQSMLFIKHAGKPGQVWHQDEDFIPTRDRSLTAAWIALDDATIDNGCPWAIPGSHRYGVLWPLRQHANSEYDSTPESFDFPYEGSDARPIEVALRSVVFFNGYLLHKSLRNRRRTASGARSSTITCAPNRCLRGGVRVDLIRRRTICGTWFSLRASIGTPREATKHPLRSVGLSSTLRRTIRNRLDMRDG
jgi:Phytanoyl-CoA dioxygenase (PhyH)